MSVETGRDTSLPGPTSHPLQSIGNFWPHFVFALGLTLSVAWTLCVGYGLYHLVLLAFW